MTPPPSGPVRIVAVRVENVPAACFVIVSPVVEGTGVCFELPVGDPGVANPE